MSKTYHQTGPYIPRADVTFHDWACIFARTIEKDPGKFGLSHSDSQIITSLAKDFSELFFLCQSTETRTPAMVARKDAIRASAKGTFRIYAAQIRANLGVTNADKLNLGLHVPDPTRTRIGRPETAPQLTIPCLFDGCHMLRYADETTPNARRKPHGVANLHLWMAIGKQQVKLPDAATTLVGIYTKNPINVKHDPSTAGLTATYFARWVTKRGLMGPWSLPVHMMIAFGGSAQDDAAATDSGAKGSQSMKLAA